MNEKPPEVVALDAAVNTTEPRFTLGEFESLTMVRGLSLSKESPSAYRQGYRHALKDVLRDLIRLQESRR